MKAFALIEYSLPSYHFSYKSLYIYLIFNLYFWHSVSTNLKIFQQELRIRNICDKQKVLKRHYWVEWSLKNGKSLFYDP